MKFVASYSGGKDSALAIHRAMQDGHIPVCLLTTYNMDENRSFFHCLPEPVIKSVADSLGVPLLLVKTTGNDYEANFEKALLAAKAHGAKGCVFGDIDIEEHRLWPSERCTNTGLTPLFPLWGESREKVVHDFINSGFIAHITIVNTRYLSSGFLGNRLTHETLSRIAAQGADICGENGEYHTFVSYGPIFKQPISISFEEQIIKNHYAILPIQLS